MQSSSFLGLAIMLFIPLTHLGIIRRRIMLRAAQLHDKQVFISRDIQARGVKENELNPKRQNNLLI
jgi:hypothetical protein